MPAAAELEIVVRARDLLTESLRRMGAAANAFGAEAERSVGRVSVSLGTLGTLTSDAARQLRVLGTVDTARLEAGITEARAEVERLRASAAGELIPGAVIERAEALEQEIRLAEEALRSLSTVDLGITERIAQAEQEFESLGRVNLAPLEASLAEARAEVTRLQASADRAGGELTELDRARLDRLRLGVREGEAALVRLRGTTEQAAAGVERLGGAFRTLRAAVLPLVPLLTISGAAFAAQRSIAQAVEFEDALSRLQVEAGLSRTELEQVRTQALATSRALGFSEAQAGPALIAAVTDGARSAAEGLERFRASAELARVTGAELARSTDLLTSVLNAYRDENLAASRAAEVTFQILRSGKVEVDELAGSLDAVLPLAAGAGASFEELGAVIAATTDRGGGFAQGMQAVRAVLAAITDPSEEARAALAGVDFSSARVRAEGLVPVLVDVARALEGNAEKIRAVFPDGRAFGALLAVLADEGRGLETALGQLQASAGGVQEALGVRLQNPAVQLGVIFNRLRSEASDAFGGAFLASTSAAVQRLGGLEATSDRVGDAMAKLGQAAGAAFPIIIQGAAEVAQRISDIAEALEGSEFEEYARRGSVAFAVLSAGLRGFAALADNALDNFIAEVVAIRDGGFIRGALSEAEIAKVSAALAQAGDLLLRVRDGAADVQTTIDKIALSSALRDIEGIEIPVKLDQAGLESVRTQLGALLERERASIELRARFKANQEELERDLDDIAESARRRVDSALRDEPIAPPPVVVDVRADLAGTEQEIAFLESELARLRDTAAEFRVQDDGSLALIAQEAVAVASRLDQASERAGKLREALAVDVEGELSRARAELQRLESAAKAASDALGFDVGGLEEARARVRELESDLRALRRESEDVQVTVRIARQGRATLEDVLGVNPEVYTSELRETIARITTELRSATGLRAEQLFSQREQAEIVLRAREIAEEVVGEFSTLEDLRGVMAEALQTGASRRELRALADALTDVAQERGRFVGQTDDERAILRSYAREVRAVREQVEELPSTALVRLQVINARVALGILDDLASRVDALSGTAVALGIEVRGDETPEAVEQAIDVARASLERANLAIRLGLEVDVDERTLNEAAENAQQALSRAQAEIERSSLEREAVRLGVSLDTDTLAADVELAREEAQAYADALADRGISNEALSLGISLDGQSIDQLQREIADVQLRAQEFAQANPILATGLQQGITGLASAIGSVASGTRSAKDAFQDFATSTVQRLAEVAAQLFIVRALIAAVGGVGTGAGSFIASAFGVAGARGLVMPAARGLMVPGPGQAPAAFARGTIIYGDAPGMAVVQRYAAGGLPAALQPHSFQAGSSASGGASSFAAGGRGSPPPGVAGLQSPAMAPGSVSRVVPFRAGGLGDSPSLDRIVSRPTLEPSSRLAGMAIVPLSGGGVETEDGRRLPVEPGPGGRLAVRPYARGGAPRGDVTALYGEAGPEAVMRVLAAPGGRPGIEAADGGVLPLRRVRGGRLGVEAPPVAHALGGLPAAPRAAAPAPILAYRLGGLPSTAPATGGGAAVRVAVAVSVPVTVEARTDRRQAEDIGDRIRAAIASDRSVRDAVAAVVASTVESTPGYRAAIRGDRV